VSDSMKSRWGILFTLVICLLISGCLDSDGEFTSGDDIVEVAYGYKDGGCWKWEGTGVPEAIWFKNRPILRKDSRCTYCSGYTFAVYFKAAAERGLLENLSAHDIHELQQHWYGTTPEYAERQAALALQDAGLGRIIDPRDAKAGDVVCFHRAKSGHSVIFLEWVYEDDVIIGLKYRSSQSTTDGIGDGTEYFTSSGLYGKAVVDPQRFYVARLFAGNAG